MLKYRFRRTVALNFQTVLNLSDGVAMQCPHCQYSDVCPYERDCPRCGRDCGYPNLRRAADSAEVSALGFRFAAQQSAAAARGCATTFEGFIEAASRSQAVMSRREKVALRLLEDQNALWRSFYDQVEGGLRRPETTQVEDERSLADERLFPKYRNEICFAALSLNGLAPAYYGTCCITFEETVVAHRASVFEENSLNLVRKINFAPIPSGFRACWERRGQLAGAKLGSKIDVGLSDSDFAGLLMSLNPADTDPDFIEVHIYGALHGSAISQVRFWPVRYRADEPIRKQIVAMCKRRRIKV
jgi:hypothetical protein